MRQYFNTKEAADRSLESRRKSAMKRIDLFGDKLLFDNSFVSCELACLRKFTQRGGYYSVRKLRWYVNMHIMTRDTILALQKTEQ